MDLRALLRNFVRSGKICRGVVDRIKYLGWLYGSVLSSGKSRQPRTLRFRLPAPVGEITLDVRANGGSDAFIFGEVFGLRYYDFDLELPPTTVLDLGANIGLTALFLARKYPDAQIVCVEPIPNNVALLRINLKRNGVTAKVVAKAISAEDQPLMMQIADDDYAHKVSNIIYGRPMDGETLRVDGISVPTLLAQLGWTRISLLKVDVEGYEGVLLRERCEWLERVDALCIECHEGYGDDDLCALAQRFGFTPPRHLDGTTLLIRNRVPISVLPPVSRS